MRCPKIVKLFEANLAVIFLLLFYFSEAMGKFSLIYLDEKFHLQKYIKLAVLVFLVITLFKPVKNLLLPFSLLLVFCLGQFFLPDSFNPDVVVSFSKFLFTILLFIYYNKHPLITKHRKLFFLTFEYLLIFNGILILLGFIFEISIFKSYSYGRWGYNGLFINSSSSSYIYAVALFYF